MAKPKLAIVCTHAIQYSAPVFRALARSSDIDIRVFYTWSQAKSDSIFDAGFGTEVKWDVPLLDGYAYQFVDNLARYPGVNNFSGIYTPTLAGEIEDWEANAILVYTWNSRSHLQALRHFKGKLPVCFRGDSTLLDRRPWWRAQMRRLFLSWVYRHIDVAIAVGTNNRRYFEWCGVPPHRIALAPHSIDTVRFAGDTAQHSALASQWRMEMGIDAKAIVVLFAGKFQSKKNPCLLLEAFRALRDGSHLVFVGNGELEESLRASASFMANVHFMPFKNQSVMPAVYRLGDVFVLPSQGPEETWGLALNEAMASGRAVIASSMVGGACDIIRSGENGWIFESGDRQALQDLLHQAIARGQANLHAIGQMAQQDSSRWSSEESAQGILRAVLYSIASHSQSR